MASKNFSFLKQKRIGRMYLVLIIFPNVRASVEKQNAPTARIQEIGYGHTVRMLDVSIII